MKIIKTLRALFIAALLPVVACAATGGGIVSRDFIYMKQANTAIVSSTALSSCVPELIASVAPGGTYEIFSSVAFNGATTTTQGVKIALQGVTSATGGSFIVESYNVQAAAFSRVKQQLGTFGDSTAIFTLGENPTGTDYSFVTFRLIAKIATGITTVCVRAAQNTSSANATNIIGSGFSFLSLRRIK